MSRKELRERLHSGELDLDALVWRSGLPGWRPARELDELVEDVADEAPEAAPPASNDPYAAPLSLRETPPPAPGAFAIDGLITVGWAACRSHWRFGLPAVLLVGGLDGLVALLARLLDSHWPAAWLGLLVSAPLRAGLLLGAIRAVRGESPGLATLVEPFRTSYWRLLPYTLASELNGLGLLALSALPSRQPEWLERLGSGTFLALVLALLVLQVWVLIRLYFAVPLIVDRGHGPLAAVFRSWSLTRGHAFTLFLLGVFGLLALLGGLLLLVIGFLPAYWLFLCLQAAAYERLHALR